MAVSVVISISAWVLRNPNVGQNLLFILDCAKKLKKERKNKKFDAKLIKKGLFEFAPECWSSVLFSKKHIKAPIMMPGSVTTIYYKNMDNPKEILQAI